jgi:hypothetical protein
VMGLALVNLDSTQSALIAVTIRDANGNVLGNEMLTLDPLSQTAFALESQFSETQNIRGVAEFSIGTGSVSALGLRFNPLGSFTSVLPLPR